MLLPEQKPVLLYIGLVKNQRYILHYTLNNQNGTTALEAPD